MGKSFQNKIMDKCSEWLNNCCIDDCDSNYDGSSDATTTTNNSVMESGFVFNNKELNTSNEILAFNGIKTDELQAALNKKPNNYENILIYKSKKIHIGDVTHIKGPIYITQYEPTINQKLVGNNNARENRVFLPIIVRRNWLAQPPIQPPIYLPQPAKFVIILHSATEEAFTQADNTLLVRLIQTFHIESRKWNDISYNFLVGADGCVFEGRGWGVEGAHTHLYNSSSVGICFIGCFMQHLPSAIALKRAKVLIEQGVETGAIVKDYKLLAHCQCSSTESPGKKLFEEIQTWDHWDESISIYKPSALIT